MSELVLAERRGSVLVLTLNRPERLNAWTDALEEDYYAWLDAAEDDPDIRAIVVTGAGRGISPAPTWTTCSGARRVRLTRRSGTGGGRGRSR